METDLSVFKEIGIDIIRMDYSFQDERDVTLMINNKDGMLQTRGSSGRVFEGTAFIRNL